jgi:hypothetical protein
MQYTVATKAGKVFTVDSDLTDNAAQNVLADKPETSSFENKLINSDQLSPKMRAWLHVLAHWALNPRPESNGGESFPGILALLNKARDAGKKFPKIKLRVDGQPIVLALNRAGKVNVTDGGPFRGEQWFGAIQLDARWRDGAQPEKVLPILALLEKDPASVATQHGVATGNCCFCTRDLSTKESRSVGYGPICAGKFGLPWGDIDPELDATGKDYENGNFYHATEFSSELD